MECGFDSFCSFRGLKEETLKPIEEYFEKNRKLLDKLPKCHATNYQSQASFSLLPSHRLAILNMLENLPELKEQPDLFRIDNPKFSYLLKELISSALKNAEKQPQARRYSKVLLDFSMYIFMLSGRASYEILAENLPIPKTSTIREFLKKYNELKNASENAYCT